MVFYHKNKFTWFHHHSVILVVRSDFGYVVCIERDQIACLDSWPTMVVYLLYLPFKLLVRSKGTYKNGRISTHSYTHTHKYTYTLTLCRFKNKVCNRTRPIKNLLDWVLLPNSKYAEIQTISVFTCNFITWEYIKNCSQINDK